MPDSTPTSAPARPASPTAPGRPGRASGRPRARRARRRSQPVELPVEMELPRWLQRNQEIAGTGLLPILRRLPALLRQALRLAWAASPSATVAVALLELARGAAAACGLLATTGALQPLLAAGPTPARVRAAVPGLLLVAAAGIAGAILDAALASTRARLAPKVRQIAYDRLLSGTVAAELAAFDDPEFYNALEKARGVSPQPAINEAIGVGGALIGLAAVGGVLGVLHPLLLPLLVVSVVPRSWATVHAARNRYVSRARRIMLARWLGQLSWLFTDRPSAPELRALTAQSFLLAEYRHLAQLDTVEQIRLGREEARTGLAGRALGGLGTGATYGALGWLLYAGLMPLAAGGTALLAIRSGQGALGRLLQSMNGLYEQGLYLADYDAYLEHAGARSRRVTGRSAPAAFDRIELRDVTFTYPGKDDPAVDRVSLTIDRGEVVALVGENGSGKTTLAKLLAGLYEPVSGSIRWDGADLAAFDADSVTDRVAVILQEPTRWPMTARANITIGRHDRQDPGGAALAAASRDAGADQVIDDLTNGYETFLSRMVKDGADLSGGQWQRLAVARGFYRDAPLLICDEPTANLDAKGEHSVYESIRELARGRTVVLITHRLASTRTADRIYVLDHGRLVEQGTHDELLAAGGAYAGLYTLQAAAYQDGGAGEAADAS